MKPKECFAPRRAIKLLDRLVAFGVLVLFLAGCQSVCTENLAPDTVGDLDIAKIDNSLVTLEPCAPPCWQGISPGETSLDQVETILKSLQFVSTSSISRQLMADGTENIYWNSSLSHRHDLMGIVKSTPKQIVTSIAITQIEYKLTLQDLIGMYGEPAGVRWGITLPDESPTCYSLSLIWPNHGLAVSVPSIRMGDIPSGGQMINSNTSVSGVSYYPTLSSAEEYIRIWLNYRKSVNQGKL